MIKVTNPTDFFSRQESMEKELYSSIIYSEEDVTETFETNLKPKKLLQITGIYPCNHKGYCNQIMLRITDVQI